MSYVQKNEAIKQVDPFIVLTSAVISLDSKKLSDSSSFKFWPVLQEVFESGTVTPSTRFKYNH